MFLAKKNPNPNNNSPLRNKTLSRGNTRGNTPGYVKTLTQ